MQVEIKSVSGVVPKTVADIPEINLESMAMLLLDLAETTISLTPMHVWHKRGAGVVITLNDTNGDGFGLQDIGDVIRLFGPVDRVSHSIKIRSKDWIELTLFSSGKTINRKRINLPNKPDYQTPLSSVVIPVSEKDSATLVSTEKGPAKLKEPSSEGKKVSSTKEPSSS